MTVRRTGALQAAYPPTLPRGDGSAGDEGGADDGADVAGAGVGGAVFEQLSGEAAHAEHIDADFKINGCRAWM